MEEFICEVCGKVHDGSYGSGRFCSNHCRHVFIGKQNKDNHVCNFPKDRIVRAAYGTWTCRFCNQIFNTNRELWSHYHSVHPNDIYGPHGEGKPAWNKGLTSKTNESVRLRGKKLKTRYANGELKGSWTGRKHSEETKHLISVKRSQWLNEHPDKHPWKRSTKFKSEPCEKLKSLLKDADINFVEEYSDFKDHNYSIDIAFPNDKIGLEVNGNQHYDKDGNLKDYYKNREAYLNSLGWKIYQIHYSLIYNNEFIANLIESIKNNICNLNIDYQNVSFKKNRICKSCGRKMKYDLTNDLCKSCVQKLNKEKEIDIKKKRILNANIDFNKFGWVNKVSAILEMSPNKGGLWVKKNMPEIYEKCFKRK